MKQAEKLILMRKTNNIFGHAVKPTPYLLQKGLTKLQKDI